MRTDNRRDLRRRRPEQRNTAQGPRNTKGTDSATDFTFSSILCLLEELDTAVSLSVAIQLRYGEWGDIVGRGVNSSLFPADYLDADTFRRDYLATCLLQKVDFISIPGVDKAAVAIKKWWDCEHACTSANIRLNREGSMPEPVWLAIRVARQKISRVLGEFKWEEAYRHAGFGKGGTTRVPRREANVANKTWGLLHVGSQYLDRASQCFVEVIYLN